jgi:hypothetical protein
VKSCNLELKWKRYEFSKVLKKMHTWIKCLEVISENNINEKGVKIFG